MALTEYWYHLHPASQSFVQQQQQQQHYLGRAQWWNPFSWWHGHHHHHNVPSPPPPPPEHIYTINFGCPRVGNAAYRSYFPHDRLRVWRVVLGWDLVPRLPDFFWHAGHTLQISEAVTSPLFLPVGPESTVHHDTSIATTATQTTTTTTTLSLGEEIRNITAYYEHYGNESLGYAGVPSGWAARPYIWVPGALESHHIGKYLQVLQNWSTPWVSDFARVEPPSNGTDYDDDDEYVDPPWDDLPLPEKKVEKNRRTT
jgi:hypothetical protein